MLYSKNYFEQKSCNYGKGGWTKEDLLNMCKTLGIKVTSKDKRSKAILCQQISNYFEKIGSMSPKVMSPKVMSPKVMSPKVMSPTRSKVQDCKKNKISTVMKEFKTKTLKTRQGKTVTNPKQAIAIALSVAKRYCE
jgi:hypothetical protein